jgi:uncharacterized membrane-anchored protein YitT (DUF2179 family)
MIAYYIAHKTIDATIQGMDESKTVWVVSKMYTEIGDAINQQLGRKVTYVNGISAQDNGSKGILFSVITRLEEQRLKTAIHAIDPKAFVVITGAHEIISKHTERGLL